MNEGYTIIRGMIPSMVTHQFKLWAMNPERCHRGNAVNGKYYDKHRKGREYDCWWTTAPPVEMWSPIVQQLHTYISALFETEDWGIHGVDCITTRPGSSKIRAHVDSPYRFDEYAMSEETLGVQIIIPLDPFTLENGATAFIPGSHAEMVHYKDIEEFQEIYDDRIRNEGVQFLSQPGDVLMYNGRTLHSTMPNNADTFRSALLINALSKDIINKANLLDKNTDRKKT